LSAITASIANVAGTVTRRNWRRRAGSTLAAPRVVQTPPGASRRTAIQPPSAQNSSSRMRPAASTAGSCPRMKASINGKYSGSRPKASHGSVPRMAARRLRVQRKCRCPRPRSRLSHLSAWYSSVPPARPVSARPSESLNLPIWPARCNNQPVVQISSGQGSAASNVSNKARAV
jgi:hypothetical protein